jgi:hypothetical protein
MFKMLQSASKFVLLLMTLTVCVAFLLRLLEAKDFLFLVGMVFAYYFTKTDKNTDADFTDDPKSN